ncbi:MAG: DUF47 family protein [Oscillospiraceae bacterium]|nr:DUF47 family protein [Oscillospiraceae bacterium]
MSLLKHREEFDYFDNFLRCANAASECAQYLSAALDGFDAKKVPAHVEAMHRIENDADALKHALTQQLAHEFITPIELEDISQLSQELDNIVDAVEDVMRRIYMLNVTQLRPEAVEFGKSIALCCDAFVKVITELRDFKRSTTIKDYIIRVNTLESEGDKLHERAMRRLFSEKADARTLVVWMTIFEALENCLDVCENAADVVESIVMKNT